MISINIFSIPVLIIAISLLVTGIVVLFNKKENILNKIFFLLCLTSTIWLSFTFLSYNTDISERAAFWYRFAYVGITFIAFTFFHYIMAVLGKNEKMGVMIKVGYAAGAVFSIDILFGAGIINGVYHYFWGFYPKRGPLHPVFLVFFLGYIITGATFIVLELVKKYKELSNKRRIQLIYILIGLLVYNSASVDFLPNYGVNIYAFGYIPTALFIIIMGYAVFKYNLMDIDITLAKAGIITVLYLIIIATPFYIGYKTQSWMLTTVISLALGTAGPLIYNAMKRQAENIILKEQMQYRSVLLEAANGMAREHDLRKLVKLTAYIIRKKVNITFVAVYLYNEKDRNYKLEAVRNHGEFKGMPVISSENKIVKLLEEKLEPVKLEDHGVFAEKNAPKVSVAVPSFIDKKLIGFMILGEKLNGRLYNADDMHVFKILANQASLAIANCLYMQEVKKSQEQLFQAEKLASVGGMAEGVAHQIKNRLNNFSMAAGEQDLELKQIETEYKSILEQNPGLKDSISYIRRAAGSVLDNVKKVSGIITGILDFAKIEHKDTLFTEFNIQEMLDSIKNYVIIKHDLKYLPLTVEIKNNGNVYGVKAQLVEAFFNMIDNSYEAIEEKEEYNLAEEEKKTFNAEIKMVVYDDPAENATMIRITDNGIGIKEEDKAKIFAPYFTTKASSISGSGIGMYLVKRIIEENHKGKIAFTSEYKKGTEVLVKIPRKGGK